MSQREFLCSPGIILALGADHSAFPNDQSTSQTFMCFGWVYLPTNPFFPQARLTVRFGPAPPLHNFDFYGPCACLPLVTPPILNWLGVGGPFSFYPIILLALHVLSVRTSFCCHLALRAGETSKALCQLHTLLCTRPHMKPDGHTWGPLAYILSKENLETPHGLSGSKGGLSGKGGASAAGSRTYTGGRASARHELGLSSLVVL